MAVAFVQANALDQATAPAPTLAFTSNVTAGNLLVAYIGWGSTSVTLTSVTDSLSQTWTIINNPTTGAVSRAAIAYFPSTSGGACTLTATFSSTTTSLIGMHEVSGCATTLPLDVSVANAQSNVTLGTDVITSTAVATTVDGDYIFVGTSDIAQGHPFTAGTGYTAPATGTSNNAGGVGAIWTEYLAPQVTHGSTTGTFSISASGDYPVTVMATFKAAASNTLWAQTQL